MFGGLDKVQIAFNHVGILTELHKAGVDVKDRLDKALDALETHVQAALAKEEPKQRQTISTIKL